MKKKIIIVVIIATILVAIVTFLLVLFIFTLPWSAFAIWAWLAPNPQEPEIKYGEFPFRLEYEVDGEQFVVEDIVICEYDGVGWNEGVMHKYRTWKKHLKSSGEADVLLLTDDTTIPDKTIKFYCFVGNAKYYMGDESNYSEEIPLTPRIYPVNSGYVLYETTVEIKEKHDIKLISWEFSKPIVNSFN